MTAIHIRDVPKGVLEALKRRAARNHRSLQKELLQILSRVAEEEPKGEAPPPIRLRLSHAKAESSWRREDIYREER